LLKFIKRKAKHYRRALWQLAKDTSTPPLPRITVVTPVLNDASNISETIESVLRQDYPELEYIIVDGGSTDGSLDIIRSYEARDDFCQRIAIVIAETDQGVNDAIAKGFKHASGEIFCFIHAGRLFDCGGLNSIGEYFAGHPKTQVIYHEDVVNVNGWKYPNVRQPEGVNTVDLLGGHTLFRDGVAWRRNAYDAVGGICSDHNLAGDFDLWLRMSAHFRFVRCSEHISCLRVHSGQLRNQLDRYQVDKKRSIDAFMAATAFTKRAYWTFQISLRRKARSLSRMRRHDRLFFPLDNRLVPPPAADIPPGTEEVPRSPIDGKPAERLLFSTLDTRFGERELNYIYLDTRHGIAITHPSISEDKLDGLYRKHYSSPPTEFKLPEGNSPYREFSGQRYWEKVLLKLPVGLLTYLFGKDTRSELIAVLKAAKVDVRSQLRFLDTGCFEGQLLDWIRERTPWRAFGLEPNDHAVEIARTKGHFVWHGHAESAVEIIPQDQQFDVIYMGQSIEHVNDPVNVLRRLRLLLAPGGVLVMSTPNLDSREIDWFGPTWAHWHAPYHRYIFSRRGLYALVRQVGLLPLHFQSFSHPYWTSMSIAQNKLGLGGSVSHAVNFDRSISKLARRVYFWEWILWNRIGKGDYCYMVVKDGADA